MTLRLSRFRAGLCTDCGKHPPTPGLVTCKGCRDLREELRLERMRFASAGLCPRCTNSPRVKGRAACAGCLKRTREGLRAFYAARKAAGLCIECAEPSGGHTRCDGCNATQRQKRAARKARKAATQEAA